MSARAGSPRSVRPSRATDVRPAGVARDPGVGGAPARRMAWRGAATAGAGGRTTTRPVPVRSWTGTPAVRAGARYVRTVSVGGRRQRGKSGRPRQADPRRPAIAVYAGEYLRRRPVLAAVCRNGQRVRAGTPRERPGKPPPAPPRDGSVPASRSGVPHFPQKFSTGGLVSRETSAQEGFRLWMTATGGALGAPPGTRYEPSG